MSSRFPRYSRVKTWRQGVDVSFNDTDGKGFSFADLTRNGIQLVVIRVEADYLSPLRSGDKFYVTTSIERISKLRIGFTQNIFRLPNDKSILKAKVFGTSLNADEKPKYFKELDALN